LQKSIEQNNGEFVKIFINKDFNPNFQNANGESLLHTAVKLKDAIITKENQLLEKVIAKNPDQNLKDKDGNTALLLAVKAQDFYLMDKLMTPDGLYVSNINNESPFSILETQLFNAVDSSNIEFIQKLSLMVPDYSRFSQNEKPLLYVALEHNKLEIAKLFLAGLSAEQTLLTAVQLSNIEIVQKLFTLIDTIDFSTMEGQEIISTASTENNPELILLLNTIGAEIELAGEDGFGAN
jgi:ankyrin repeat protein